MGDIQYLIGVVSGNSESIQTSRTANVLLCRISPFKRKIVRPRLNQHLCNKYARL